MSKKERWLATISMLASVLPVVIIALIQSFVVPPFVFSDIVTGTEHKLSAGQFNIIGLFCIVPYVIMLVVRLLRSRGLRVRNFTVVAVATLCMNVVYVISAIYILRVNVRGLTPSIVFRKIDYTSMVCSVICLIFTLLSTLLPDLPPNPFFGVKNEKTMSDPLIWKKVNASASTAIAILFSLMAVATAYAKGVFSIVVLVVAIIAYYGWAWWYSSYVYKKFNTTI